MSTITTDQFSTSTRTLSKSSPLADLKRLPLLIRLVLLFLVAIFTWSTSFLGFNLTGLAWAIPFALSLLIVALNLRNVTFPAVFWLPWVLLLFTYFLLVDRVQLDPRVIPLQRTLQLLCPLVVGMAVSTWRPTADGLRAFLATCRRLAYLILLIVLLKTGILLTGVLPSATGLAPEAIAVTLLTTLFATNLIITRSKNDLMLWAMLVCVPFIAVTRTAIVATLVTLPFSLAPLRVSRRILAMGLIALAGVAIFNTEHIQKKMFYSGQGTLADLNGSNDDLATSGRKFMWEEMRAVAQNKEWTGHGTGAGETFTYYLTGNLAYPHNDWLLTFFDYGYLGIGTYVFCLLLTVWHSFSRARKESATLIKVLLYTGASAFIPFAIMMTTDNIMVYASYFGNLHFTIMGVAYGALRARQEEITRG